VRDKERACVYLCLEPLAGVCTCTCITCVVRALLLVQPTRSTHLFIVVYAYMCIHIYIYVYMCIRICIYIDR